MPNNDIEKQKVMLYLPRQDYILIKDMAKQTGLSMNQYFYRTALGQKIESKADSRAVIDLIKINADFGRLGGLLKLWLSEGKPEAELVRKTLNEILKLKEEFKQKIKEL